MCSLALCILFSNGPAYASRDDDTSLIEAAGRGDVRIFKMMLDMGANPNAFDPGGNSAILMAAYHSQRDMVRRLIELHANVNISGNIGYTPLATADRKSVV